MIVRRLSISTVLFFIMAVAAAAQQPQPSGDDLARRVIDMVGGEGAWQKARYISFDFVVEREGKVVSTFSHRWDRSTGEDRVTGKDRDGLPFDALINVNTHMGRGTRNGVAVTDLQKFRELYDLAYRRFVNDTSWLLMPLKAFDPGVHRVYDGQRSDSCGRTWDMLKLTFDDAPGLTPGDTYWFWVNRDTNLIDEWDIRLQGTKPDDPPLEVLLHDYRRIGGLLLPTRTDVRGKGQTIRLQNIQVLTEVPKERRVGE